MLDVMFATPKRHTLARNRVFWRILRQNLSRAFGCSALQEPPKNQKTNTFLVRKVTHAGRQNAWTDRDELLHRCRGPRRNHLCRFVLRSLTGFGRGGGGGQILAFSIDLLRRPYNTLALPCECVITTINRLNDYILSEIGTRTREQDTAENSTRRQSVLPRCQTSADA